MTNSVTELVLGCKSWQQAQDIIDQLFSKQLITHAEVLTMPSATEVKLIMQNIEENIFSIKGEISQILGHDRFELQSTAGAI